MKNSFQLLKNYKYTLSFVVFSFLIPFVISVFLNSGLQIPRDIVISFFTSLLLFLTFGKRIELRGSKKSALLITVFIIAVFSPVLLIIAFIFSPSQKDHDRVMYEICLPELRKYYGISEGEGFPQTSVDKNRKGKWWFQHLECEENVMSGKGPIFSDNPPEFKPIN